VSDEATEGPSAVPPEPDDGAAEPGAAEPGDTEPDGSDLDEARARVEEELAGARQRLADVPAEIVVGNHAMGLYELAAIHLSNQPPALDQAALSIDAFACLVEGLGDRLGPNAGLLRDALSQIRIAFVQVKGTMVTPGSAGEAPEG
jgi:hypothetical protein